MTEERTAEGAVDAEDGVEKLGSAQRRGAAAPRIDTRGRSSRKPHVHQEVNACSGDIIDAAIRVHSEIGPGVLEQVYKVCLAYELRDRGRRVATEVPIEVIYRGVKVNVGYRADMIVDGIVIVEAKAASKMTPRDDATLLSHLKLSGLRVGLLINFHELHLRDGIKRMVNRL